MKIPPAISASTASQMSVSDFPAGFEVAVENAPIIRAPPTVKPTSLRNHTQSVARTFSTCDGGLVRSRVPKYQGIAASKAIAKSTPRQAHVFMLLLTCDQEDAHVYSKASGCSCYQAVILRTHCQLPPPKLENGKHTTDTLFGKQMPSKIPTSIAPKAHPPRVDRDTGTGPSASLPSTPIQKQPMPPMRAPMMRSRRVTGACHHRAKFCILRRKNPFIM